ncbi:hypothetical protein OHB26_19780 [Nocardia sp. NBC_01503]|uniref:hypothetical protein n=1 Tax=Nocardia sp. NBC_01503 TaxID=2975997 RepID=UPI002E7AF7FC|nr:hypothetical protein [Nocardia sp. NBC_01503]WTL29257.1 hypothetical protein OHB26_19780 [Nocardia sp. NBC_01503]
MKRRTPTLVAVYDLGAWEPRRVAEFRLTEQGAVALEVLVPGGCRLAEQWHRSGVEILGAGARVHPAAGPDFMLALLQPFGMSYYAIVDESP